MTKFLLPIAINVINKAVDKIPEDLDELLKKFVVLRWWHSRAPEQSSCILRELRELKIQLSQDTRLLWSAPVAKYGTQKIEK